jgi:tRNA(His) 5'-end guanylyltransferase
VASHKLLLTACGPFFDSSFNGIRDDRHDVIVLFDVTCVELKALRDYMYRREVNISQDQLADLLKETEALQIRGLNEPAGP